ncbi:MAG: FMN-binding glutamate synthase family protein [Candidatus Obscuribacterales bacterium]|nr:FMN-binding glutamate synthase family protein [Candidatus Obscuribacterales bacterium]
MLFWTISTVIAGLLAGLVGWHVGEHPAAFAFTLGGILAATAVRDILRNKHAILAGTLLAATAGWYFFNFEGLALGSILAFCIQLAVNDFALKKNALLPIAAAITFIAWCGGFWFFNPMSGLIFALIGFLTVIGIDDYFLQRKHSILRNFPLLGWFRYGFELIGDELRQYWFMSDREERPYDRDTRRYIYRSAKGVNNNLGFGTSRPYRDVGEIHMLPTMFPTPDVIELGNRLPPLVIGKRRRTPYQCAWPINISGMSWGALSAEAVMALASGAKLADIHILTGEGGLTPYHLDGVIKRPARGVMIRHHLKQLAHVASFKLVAKPELPEREIIGGGKIIVQLGPAKFGFRQCLTDTLSGTAERGLRKNWTNKLDWRKIALLSDNDQIVGIEVKLQQGGKPGQGGKLPKEKITEEISEWRGIPMDKDCYSPNAWEEFNNVTTMFEFVAKLQEATGKPVGIKIAVGQESFIEEIARMYQEAGDGPDFITIDGGEGGTGAGPVALADHMGLPILHAIPKVDNILRAHSVRDEVVLIASGQIAKGSDVAIAIALGADAVNIGRGNMIAEGCIMAKRCHTNTCPVGIATQDPRFRRGLDPEDKYVRVGNYNIVLQRELLMILKSIGVRTPWELTRHHLSVVTEPMVEKTMAEVHPYPDGSKGERNPILGEVPANNHDNLDRFGPRLVKISGKRY